MFIRVISAIIALFIFIGCAPELELVPPLPYEVNISDSRGIAPDEMEQAVEAVEAWITKANERHAKSFIFTGIRSGNIDYAMEVDGVITIYFATRDEMSDKSRALGVTRVLGEAKAASDVRIFFENFAGHYVPVEAVSGEAAVSYNENVRKPHLLKLKSVMTHELGHVLGIYGHSKDPKDVMYHEYQGVSDLTKHDVDLFCQKYGC